MVEKKVSKKLMDVALGNLAPDMALDGVTVFNAFTGEFVENQLILIKDGRFAYVGKPFDYPKGESTEIINCNGLIAIPGLIDAHTHIIFRSGLKEYIKHAIPSGVTTIITETIELATICGKDGIEYFVAPFEKQPINMFYTIPALCGLTEEEERKALTWEDMLDLLEDEKCLGLGEIYWGNAFIEGAQGRRILDLVDLTLSLGKRVEGHTAGAKENKLQAYTLLGVSSCHEPISEEEVLERLRLGYWVMVREGSIRRELDGIKGIFKRDIDFRRLVLSTDGVDPEGFMEEGYLDYSLKRLLSLGVPPSICYQMVTINPAEHFRLDDIVGSIAPFRSADLVLIPSPEDYRPITVICRGKKIYEKEEILVDPIEADFPEYMFNTVHFKEINIPDPPRGKVRMMEQVTRLVTRETFSSTEDEDVNMVLAIDRMGSGRSFLGFVKGYGLKRGACGSTMCWDTGDAIVVGCDKRSMETVLKRLQEIQGGAVFAIGDNVISEYRAPVCGIISLEPMEKLYRDIKFLERSLRENGVKWEKPLLTIDTMGTTAIPHLRITHRGYVRMKDRKILNLYDS